MKKLIDNRNGAEIFVSDIKGGIKKAEMLAKSAYYDLVEVEEPKVVEIEPEIKVKRTRKKKEND